MSTTSLHKTNPRLSGNIKIVIDSNSDMWIESINSTPALSRIPYKGYKYNKSLAYGTNIRNFCNQFADKTIIFDVVDEKQLNISTSISDQYSQLYHYGCYSEESQLINENMRFFAPLHVDINARQPELFVIYKIPAEVQSADDFNEISSWINKGEIVHVQDLTQIQKLIFNQLSESNIDIDFTESIKLNGLNIDSGLWNRTEDNSIVEFLSNEVSITEFENWITNTFSRNKTIYSNCVNLEFAFTDSTADNRFWRYAGFYVNKNYTTFDIASSYESSGAIRLLETESGYRKLLSTDVESSYKTKQFSRFANSFGVQKPAIIEFDFVLKPNYGEALSIQFNGVIEHTIQFGPWISSMSIANVKNYILNSFNNEYQGSSSTVKASIVDGKIRLESNSSLSQFEQLKLIVPSTFIVVKPLFTTTTYLNTFIGASSSTISLNDYINPNVYNSIMYINSQGNETFANIIQVYKYKGDYFYKLDQIIDKAFEPDNIWFVEEQSTKPIIASVIDHKQFDFDQTESVYSDVLDFDTAQYRDYLLAQIQRPDYIGNVVAYYEYNDISEVSAQELADYIELVGSNIEKYFSAIDINRQFLFKNIDILTSEASTIDNEYNRLEEVNNINLNSINRLYQFINKWSFAMGTDVYTNPYRLNISLPFRHDAFSASQGAVSRDIRYHTHSWFIIGEGQLPYMPINESTIHKILSYTRYPITPQLLMSTDEDAYLNLQWQTEHDMHHAWSIIKYDKYQDACYTFFRGTMYRIEDRSLDGYRFSTILTSSKSVIDDVFNIDYYKNDVYKTLTLLIEFYIPDPILTSLETGLTNYFLDRSLLYFSNEIYATTKDALDFGTDRISLKLYDSSTQKTYLGQNVTNQWWYNSPEGTILHVSRGDASVFNVPFDELLVVGDDFTIKYTSSDDIVNSPFFGMTIEFQEIVEVSKTHFWCKRIILNTNLTYDPDGIDDLDISDNIVDTVQQFDVYPLFLANPMLFSTNNTVYISRAIAFENCIYNKIVSATANNARYREISLANIKNFMLTNSISVNGNQSELKTNILSSAEIDLIISKESKEHTIVKLLNSYVFPAVRQNGKYQPVLKTMLRFNNSEDFNNVYPGQMKFPNEYKLNVSKNVNQSEYKIEKYIDQLPDAKSKTFYSYISAITGTNIVRRSLPWITSANEHRRFSSLVFNSQEKIVQSIQVTDQLNVDLVQLMRNSVLTWLKFNPSTLTSTEKINLLKLYFEVLPETVQNFDIEEIIVRNFIIAVFLKIYRIERIVTSTGTIVQFNIDNEFIQFIEPTTGLLTIQFTR